MTGTFSHCSLRFGSVCRAVLAAAWPGGQEAGVGGKSGTSAQHWPGRGCGGRPLQDGVPSGQQVRSSLVMGLILMIYIYFLSVMETKYSWTQKFRPQFSVKQHPFQCYRSGFQPSFGLLVTHCLFFSSAPSSSHIHAVPTSSDGGLEGFKAYPVFKEIENHLREVKQQSGARMDETASHHDLDICLIPWSHYICFSL